MIRLEQLGAAGLMFLCGVFISSSYWSQEPGVRSGMRIFALIVLISAVALLTEGPPKQ